MELGVWCLRRISHNVRIICDDIGCWILKALLVGPRLQQRSSALDECYVDLPAHLQRRGDFVLAVRGDPACAEVV